MCEPEVPSQDHRQRDPDRAEAKHPGVVLPLAREALAFSHRVPLWQGVVSAASRGNPWRWGGGVSLGGVVGDAIQDALEREGVRAESDPEASVSLPSGWARVDVADIMEGQAVQHCMFVCVVCVVSCLCLCSMMRK